MSTPAQSTTYSSVKTGENDTKPPIYKQFFISDLQKAAKSGEKSPVKLGQTAYEIVCNSVFTSVFTLISALLPVAQLIVGIMFKNECDIQPNIPLWLIVFGACGTIVGLIRIISTIIITVKSRKSNSSEVASKFTCLTCIVTLLSIFLFIWFLIGNYWVYSVHSTVRYDRAEFPKEYCDRFAYLFAFWSIIATWILVGLYVLCFTVIIAVVLSIALSTCSACCLASADN